MTYIIDALYTEYKKRKKLIYFYIALCVLLAFFAGPYIAINQSHVSEAAEELDELDTVETLNRRFVSKSIQKFVGNYSNVIAISAEPITGMLFLGTVQYVNNLCGKPLEMEPVPIAQPALLIVLLVFFIGYKLMKVFESTKVIGELTLGTLSHFMGTACILAMGVMCVVGFASVEGVGVVQAAMLDETAQISAPVPSVLTGAVSAVIAALMAIALYIVAFIVKTVARGIGIIEMIFSHVEVVTAACEILKTAIVIVFCGVSIWLNNTSWGVWISFAIDLIVFVICCFLFRTCYTLINYYGNVYARTTLHTIFRKKKHYPLVPKRLPRRVKKVFVDKKDCINAVLPVYVEKCSSKSPLPLKKFSKVYFVNCDNSNGIILKKYTDIKNYFYGMDNLPDRKVYLRRGKTKYEIYTYLNDEKNLAKKSPKKELSLVFSKDYRFVIDRLFEITQYVDVVEEKALAKAEKKLSRKEKRKESFNNFKTKIKNVFASDEDEELYLDGYYE